MDSSLLTLRDVAELAGVRRPVVSVWRQRPAARGQVVEFPPPISVVNGQERFERSAIVRYLESTRRGNNREVDLDAGAFDVPDGATLDGIITLLCLRDLAGDDVQGLDIVEIAAEVDPADRLLYREVAALQSPPVEYVDELWSGAFGAGDALDRLMATRVGRSAARDDLSREAVSVLGELVGALLTHLGEDADLVDGSGGRATAAFQLAESIRHSIVLGDDAREIRRRAHLRGLALESRTALSALRVDSVLGLDPPQALKRIDDLELELDEHDLGFVVGPAALLCDGLREPAVRKERDTILRNDKIRLAVRLPRGLWVRGRRQALGLWVLGGRRGDVGRTSVADISDLGVDAIDAQALALDAVAAIAQDHTHAHTYVRSRETAAIVSTDTVVARGLRANPPSPRIGSRERLRHLEQTIAAPVDIRPLPAIEGVVTPASTRTVESLRRWGALKLLRGSRIDAAWSSPDGTVRTVAPLGGPDELGFDPLDIERRAPAARRTEPGDVVFVTSPPAAVVDSVGGRLVASPARVLRIVDESVVGPYSLAAQINRMPSTARDPEAWEIKPTDARVEAKLSELDAIVSQLRAKLAAADEYADILITATGSGALTLMDDILDKNDTKDH